MLVELFITIAPKEQSRFCGQFEPLIQLHSIPFREDQVWISRYVRMGEIRVSRRAIEWSSIMLVMK